MLSITMAAVGIGLGVVGLIGYQSMKDGALEQASRVADKVATHAASRHLENIRQSVEGLQSGDVHQAVEPTSIDRKSTRLNSSHYCASGMPSSARKKTKTTYT